MTPEKNVLAVWSAQEAIEGVAKAQVALNFNKIKLGQALGELVGSRVTIQGYPATATVFTGINEETGQQRYVAASVYSLRETAKGRQPRIIEDCAVLAADAHSVEVSAHSVETTPHPRQIVSYVFRVNDILGIAAANPSHEEF